MGRAPEDLIDDIIGFCHEVAEHLQGGDLDDYLRSRTIQRAVEHSIQLIGEATRRLGSDQPDIGVPWDKIQAMRNLLVHIYERVESALIYDTAIREVPKLLGALEAWRSKQPQK